MSHNSPEDGMAAVKLLSHGSPGKGAEELKRRLKNNELTPSDVRPIAEKLAENQLWSTVDRLTELDLLDKNTNAQLRTAYPKMIRPTFQLFDEAFCDDLRKKKMAPQAIRQIALGMSLLKQGSKEAALLYLLRVVEGVLTDLCLLCIEKLEVHKDKLQSTYQLEVNEYTIKNKWGMFAKSTALNEIGVLDLVEYDALHKDLNEPRNTMFHSYESLPEREVEALIRQIYAILHSLATRIMSETPRSSDIEVAQRSF